MSLSGYDLGPPSPDATRGAVNSESALTVPGSASPEGTYLASPQETDSPVPIDDLWDKVLDNYGLLRPTEVTEIHVFRGATVVPVLNVSSRVFWLELDDKALLDSYGVLQHSL